MFQAEMCDSKDIIVGSHEEAIKTVKTHQLETSSKFVTVSTQKNYGNLQFAVDLARKKVRWELKGGHTIPFDGMPFLFLGKHILHCHMGPDRQKNIKQSRRLEREKNNLQQQSSKRPSSKIYTTKKVNCPAKISIKCIAKFHGYKIEKNTSSCKQAVAAALRKDLGGKSSINVQMTFQYYVHLPSSSEHKHPEQGQESGTSELLDPEIISKIQELVSKGVDDVKELQRHLESYVEEELQPMGSVISQHKTRFCPSLASLRAHMKQASAATSESSLRMPGSTLETSTWSHQMWENVQKCSSFIWEGEKKRYYRPFVVNGTQVGIMPPVMVAAMATEPNLFVCADDGIHLSPALTTYDERTEKMAEFLQRCRHGNKFITLAGWRNENYAVSRSFYDTPLLEMERAATCLFGVKQYGVHVNGYCNHPSLGRSMWIAKRSPNKQTYPSKLDQIAAGGLPAGMGPRDCMMKESEEEASIPQSLSSRAVSVGAISYFFEDERGLFPETQFVFDLELPVDFEPKVKDGEVSNFFLWPLKKVKEEIALDKFKPNCGLVCLDFLMRHGYVSPDEEPHYLDFLSRMHQAHF